MSLRGKIKKIDDKFKKHGQDIENVDFEIKNNDLNVSEYKKIRAFLTNPAGDQQIKTIDGNIKTINEDILKEQNNLDSSQSAQYQRAHDLRNLYDKLLQRVVSPRYDGEIILPPHNDLDFRIKESAAGRAGEAVETLALVLADVTAMLWRVAGHGNHPGFLLHDSPREADLHSSAYNRFLCAILVLSQELGGKDAPFQYIVTTTTEPPKELLDADVVRLKLKTHPTSELLLGRILNMPPLL